MASLITYNRGIIYQGIEVGKNDKLGNVIRLGIRGRGRYEALVKLDNRTPPIVENNQVQSASLVKFKAGDKDRFVLRKCNVNGDMTYIVRVNTNGPYTRGYSGGINVYWGSPTRIVAGHDAWGAAGRIGTLPDELWALKAGDALLVTTAGGNKSVGTRVLSVSPSGIPEVWSLEDFRSEVLGSIDLTNEEREEAIKTAQKRNQNKLAAFLSCTVSEEVVV